MQCIGLFLPDGHGRCLLFWKFPGQRIQGCANILKRLSENLFIGSVFNRFIQGLLQSMQCIGLFLPRLKGQSLTFQSALQQRSHGFSCRMIFVSVFYLCRFYLCLFCFCAFFVDRSQLVTDIFHVGIDGNKQIPLLSHKGVDRVFASVHFFFQTSDGIGKLTKGHIQPFPHRDELYFKGASLFPSSTLGLCCLT